MHSTAFSLQTGSGWIPWLKGKGGDGKDDGFFLLRIDSFSSNNPPFYFKGSQFKKFIPGGPAAALPTLPPPGKDTHPSLDIGSRFPAPSIGDEVLSLGGGYETGRM